MDDMSFENGRYEVSAPGFGDRLARKLRILGHVASGIPLVSLVAAPVLTGTAALMEMTSSLTRGEYSKAFKQVLSGSVDTVATGMVALAGGATWWVGNSVWALVSGNSLAEQARQATNWALDSVDDMTRGAPVDPLTVQARTMQALSANPMTQGAMVGGVGYAPELAQQIDMNQAPSGLYDQPLSPTHHTDMIAQQRGQDPAQARMNWLRDADNRQSMKELVAAKREQEKLAGQQSGKA